MEKKSTGIDISLPPVKLYLEDIHEILTILNTYNLEDIFIKTMNYQFNETEVDQIFKYEERTSELTITALKPYYLSINFKCKSLGNSYISTSESEGNALGVVQHLKSFIFTKKIPFINIFYYKWFPYIFLILSLIAVNILNVRGIINIYLFIIFLLCIFLLYLLFMFPNLGFFGRNTIIFSNKNDRISFWKRNKDKIYVGLIIGTITSIISIILTLIFTQC